MDDPSIKLGQMVVLESALEPILSILDAMTDPPVREAIVKALAK